MSDRSEDVIAEAARRLTEIRGHEWRQDGCCVMYGDGDYDILINDCGGDDTYCSWSDAEMKFIAAAPRLVRGLLDALALFRQERDEARAEATEVRRLTRLAQGEGHLAS